MAPHSMVICFFMWRELVWNLFYLIAAHRQARSTQHTGAQDTGLCVTLSLVLWHAGTQAHRRTGTQAGTQAGTLAGNHVAHAPHTHARARTHTHTERERYMRAHDLVAMDKHRAHLAENPCQMHTSWKQQPRSAVGPGYVYCRYIFIICYRKPPRGVDLSPTCISFLNAFKWIY